MKKILSSILLAISSLVCAEKNKLSITSPEFSDHSLIPIKYSFNGENISPPLTWSGGPKQTKSYAVVMIDYDAKESVGHPIVHWVMYNIPASVSNINAGERRFTTGMNSYDKPGYIGMNPPRGQLHRYHFYIYALDVSQVDFDAAPSSKLFFDKVQKHLLESASIIGTFEQ